MFDGTPMDWGLQYRIATEIPDAVWDAGPEEVALAIQAIEREFRTGIGPGLRRNEDGKWALEPDVDLYAEPVDFAIGQVRVALTAALRASGGNGIKPTSPETVLCEEAFAMRDMPSVVATQLWSACMGMTRAIDDGWYPDDTVHLGLKNTLYTSVEELCEQDDLIKARIGRLAALETRRYPTAEEKQELAKLPDEVRGDMTEEAQAQLEQAVNATVNTDKPPRAYRARLVNWLTTMGKATDTGMKNEKRANWLLKLGAKIAGWFFEDDVTPPNDPDGFSG